MLNPKLVLLLATICALKWTVSTENPVDYTKANSVYDFTAKDITGNEVSLEKYKGHVLIIVNVASNCGLTENNYKQLNELYEKYGESKGLRILAFPCNQFLQQENGTNEEIAEFAKQRGVKFDMFSKIDVNGDNAHPLYKFLKFKQPGTDPNDTSIEWNFAKFIIDKNGQNSIHNDFFGICIPLAYYSCILPDIFENRGKTFRTAYKFCTALIFILGILCNLSEIYKLYQLFTDENFIFDEVIRNYIITSYHLASLIRCKILKGKISKIMFKKVIKYEEKIYASKNSELITVYKQTTSFVRNTMAYYFALILVVIIFYIAAPAFRDPYIIHKGNVTIEIRQVPLSSWTPYDDQYWPCFIWTSAVGTYLTIFFVTSDLICFGFIMFGLCQIRILKYFIQNFDKYSKVLQKQHGFDLIHSSTILQRELIRMHEEIIEYVSEVNTTLRYMMLLDFLPSSVQIAGIIFQMMTNLSIIQCILLGQFVCTLIARIFIYCNSSHNLFEQSQNIASSWYETDWTEWPNYLKKNIVLCMIRAQKPLKITIADMQDLTLNTFLTILQGTYTYMMVLTTNSLKS